MNHIFTPRVRLLEAKSTSTVVQKYYVTSVLQALCSEEFTVETFAVRLNLREALVLWPCWRDLDAPVKFISFLMEKVYQPVVSWKGGLFSGGKTSLMQGCVEFASSTQNFWVLILAYLLFYLWTLKLAKSWLFLGSSLCLFLSGYYATPFFDAVGIHDN